MLPSTLLRRFLSLYGPPHQEELLSPKGTKHLVSTWAVHASRFDLGRVRLTPRGQRMLYGLSVRATSQFLSSAVAASDAREAIGSLTAGAAGSGVASLSLAMQCVHGFVCFGGGYDNTLKPRCTRTACIEDAQVWYQQHLRDTVARRQSTRRCRSGGTRPG